MRNLLVATLLSSLAFTGCKKKDAGTTGSGSGSAASAPAAAKVEEKKPTCSPTALKEPSGLFCAEAPGFAAQKEEDNGDSDPQQLEKRLTFKREANNGKAEASFTVSWFPNRDDAGTAAVAAANMESDYKNNTGEDKGDFGGGKGKFFVFADKTQAMSHKLYAVIQGNKHTYECETTSWNMPIDAEALAGCKSVIPTD
jgi:hypothetical protein